MWYITDECSVIYIIKEKLETLTSMESYLPTSDRHAASCIFSDGPSKQLVVVKLRYNALKLFFYNVAILRQRACFRQRLSFAAVSQAKSFAHSASTSVQLSKWLYWRYSVSVLAAMTYGHENCRVCSRTHID